jgi:hypothetical protein
LLHRLSLCRKFVPSPQKEVIRLALAVNASNQPGNGEGNSSTQPDQLWLPLDFLEARLGFRRQAGIGGEVLEWFGRTVALRELDTRALGDEVGFDVGDWLSSVGVTTQRKRETLTLGLPSPALQGLRRGKGATAGRLVLDLDGPTFAQRIGTDLAFALRVTTRQQNILKQLGLDPIQRGPAVETAGPGHPFTQFELGQTMATGA